MKEYYNAMRLGRPLNHLYQTVIEGKVPFLPALLVVQVGKPRRNHFSICDTDREVLPITGSVNPELYYTYKSGLTTCWLVEW